MSSFIDWLQLFSVNDKQMAMKCYERNRTHRHKTQRTKSAPEGGIPHWTENFSYENVNRKQNHSEEVSTQAMKLTTLNTIKGTTKNAPQGGKQKAIKHQIYEIKHQPEIYKIIITHPKRHKTENKT